MKKYIITIIVIIVLIVGYYALSPLFIRKSQNDASPILPVASVPSENNVSTTTGNVAPNSPSVIATGSFVARVHSVSGQVSVIGTGNSDVLRMENFSTLNGPNLRVYLSKDLTNADFVDLGPLKATDGNINYDIPSGTDTNVYSHVLIWCKDFSVLFGSADLNQS